MNFEKLMARIKAILMTPKTEWPVIAAESTTVAGLYKFYIAILAVLPALGSLIMFRSLGAALMQYVIILAMIYLMSLIVDALAPTFGGQKNPLQALKLVAYTYTPSFLAGILVIVPVLGPVIALVAGIYAIYLLYLGLPHLMKCPEDKAVGYTAVIVLIGIVLAMVVMSLVFGVIGINPYSGMRYG